VGKAAAGATGKPLAAFVHQLAKNTCFFDYGISFLQPSQASIAANATLKPEPTAGAGITGLLMGNGIRLPPPVHRVLFQTREALRMPPGLFFLASQQRMSGLHQSARPQSFRDQCHRNAELTWKG
jgi:hypothetical protein